MQKRRLGNHGPPVSALRLGCTGMSGSRCYAGERYAAAQMSHLDSER